MKRLIFTFVSAAAVCAFVSATPTLAATSTGAAAVGGPLDQATAVVATPFDAVGAIASAPFAQAGGARTQPRCYVTQDSYGSNGRYTSVCQF